MYSLNMSDVGDCCSAQARFLVRKGYLFLAFCGHHFNSHEKRLSDEGWTVVASNLEGLEEKVSAGVS